MVSVPAEREVEPRASGPRGLLLSCALLFAWSGVFHAAPAEMDLYDWMGPAPIVVHGEVVQESGRLLELEIELVIRGPVTAGERVAVDLRPIRRKRPVLDKQLELGEGRSFLLLLEPAPPRKRAELPEYLLVRGPYGVREVPAEGAPALLGAVEVLAAIQLRNSESATWQRMSELLEDPNPILISTAVRHHIKFRRGAPELLLTLRPLLDHPRPDLREGSARLIGAILDRHRDATVPEAALLHAELAARARRDPETTVRVAATEALDRLSGEGTEELLEQIARLDPEQLVRYTAQRLLYERRAAEERP